MNNRNRSANRSRLWRWRSAFCVAVALLVVFSSFSVASAGAQDGDGGQPDPPTDAGGDGGDTDGGDSGGGDSQDGADTPSTAPSGGGSRPAVSGWALGLAAALVLIAIVIVLQRGSSRPRRPKQDNLYDSYDTPLARTEAPMPSNPNEPPAAQG